MHRRVKLADRVQAGRLDGDLHAGHHGARAEADNANALRAIFRVAGAGQRQGRCLRCVVVAPAFQRARRGAGADIDDNARALIKHGGYGGAHAVIDALEIDVRGGNPGTGIRVGEPRDRFD